MAEGKRPEPLFVRVSVLGFYDFTPHKSHLQKMTSQDRPNRDESLDGVSREEMTEKNAGFTTDGSVGRSIQHS